jgi:hypothetical protein
MSGNLANKTEEEIHKMASKTGMDPDKKVRNGTIAFLVFYLS